MPSTERRDRPLRHRQPRGLGYSPEAIEGIVVERKSAEALAAKAEPLAQHGGDRKSAFQGSGTTLKGKRDASYLTARIARDRPDILDRMKGGEFPSVRAAAKEAGIVRDQMRRLRQEVTRLLNPALPKHGGVRQAEEIEQGYIVTLPPAPEPETSDRGNSATYTLRRLQRDRPDLAEQVICGA